MSRALNGTHEPCPRARRHPVSLRPSRRLSVCRGSNFYVSARPHSNWFLRQEPDFRVHLCLLNRY